MSQSRVSAVWLAGRDATMSAGPSDSDGTPSWDLEALVGDLRLARQGHNEQRDEVIRRQRPSLDAMIEVVRDLKTALFPAHFGVSDLTDASINSLVARSVTAGLHKLQEQIRCSLIYASGRDESAAVRTGADARDLTAEVARVLPAIRWMLETDIRAALAGDPAANSRAEVVLCYPGFTALVHHRLAHALYRLRVPLLPRMISEIAHSATGIDLHPGASIDESFFVDHGTGVVIGETSIIGKRVRIYQGVTLGARSFPTDAQGSLIKGVARHPILEDDVVVYAGATVLGRVTIGRGAVIGGNVWLTHSVPPRCNVTQAQSRNELYSRGNGI